MTTAIQTTTRAEWANAALAPVLQAIPNCDLILPSLPFTPPAAGFRPQVSVVTIDPNPDGGEVFPLSWAKSGSDFVPKTLGYTKVGLMKLATAAGARFPRSERRDDRRDPNYCEFYVEAEMLNAAGELVSVPGTAAINLVQWREDRWQELVAKNAKAGNRAKDEAALRADLDAEMASFRKHWIGRCETKAMLRAIRALLAIKANLTPEQVARPKVLMRFVLDTNDPEIRDVLVRRASGAEVRLYGPSHAEVVDERPRRLLEPVTTDDEEPEGDEDTPPVGAVAESSPPAPSPPPVVPAPPAGHPRNAFFAALDRALALSVLPASVDAATVKTKTPEGQAERRKLLAALIPARNHAPETMTPDDWAAATAALNAIVSSNTPPEGDDF